MSESIEQLTIFDILEPSDEKPANQKSAIKCEHCQKDLSDKPTKIVFRAQFVCLQCYIEIPFAEKLNGEDTNIVRC